MRGSKTRTYLDFNATMPPFPEAVTAAVAVLSSTAANPSSPHAEGREARRLLTRARAEVAGLVDAAPDEVVFTSSGTEANAMALNGLLLADGPPAGKCLLVSAVEHPSLFAAAEQLARLGVDVVVIAVDRDGLLRLDALTKALTGRGAAVVAVQLANQETGVLQPIAVIGRLAHEAGARVHCDAVQAAGRAPVSFRALGVDTMAVAGHKFGAPVGAGALVVRDGVTLAPLVPGAQENHRRGGSENLPAIVGMGVAARLARERATLWSELAGTRDLLERELAARLAGCVVYGAAAPRLPNTTCVGLPPALRGGVVVAALDLGGFAVSSGPACSSGVERGSAVVEAMGFDGDAAQRTVRISLGPGSSAQQVLALAEALERVAQRRSREVV